MKNSKINLKSYDTIVIGGGIAGTIAAISAARLGNKVALIQDRPVLGGNASSEVRLEPSGASARGRNRNARETGIIEELRMEIRYRNMQYNPFRWSLVLYEWAKKEVNIDLYLNTKFTKVSMKKCNTGKIASIDAVQLSNEKFFRFISEIYIDATGDGIVAAKAGADYRFGRESEGEHDENLAPKKSDKKVRGSTLMFSVKKLNYNVSENSFRYPS